MTEELAGAASRLRAEFDEVFARPHPADPPEHVDVLEIQVAGQRYALRLAEVLAVHADRKLVRAPSPRPDLLGLVGVRGVVAPVYDLAKLLGHGGGGEPRWLALVRGAAPFGLAFERFERHRRVALSAITLASVEGRGFTSGSVETSLGPLPLIDLFALLRAVTNGSGQVPTPEREETR